MAVDRDRQEVGNFLGLVTLSIFYVPFGHLYVFFRKMSIQISCPFLCDADYFAIQLYESFIYLGYQSLIGYMICKYFLPFNRLCFTFVDGFLCCSEAFSFDIIPLIYFAFIAFSFGVIRNDCWE